MRATMWALRITLVAASTATFTISGAAAASTWPVSISGSNGGESHSSGLPSAPSAPSVACTSGLSDTVKVSWDTVATASTYDVHDATSAAGGPYSLAASGVTTTSWTSGALASGNYWFEVTAFEGTNWQSPDSSVTSEVSIVNLGVTGTCESP